MHFNFEKTSQLSDAISYVKLAQYELVNKAADKSGWIRLATPLLTLSTAVLVVAQIVTLIVEPIIKAITNIFGSLFSEECHFTLGLKQITKGLGEGLLYAALCIFEVVSIPLGMSIAPKMYTDYVIVGYNSFRIRNYDPNAKDPLDETFLT